VIKIGRLEDRRLRRQLRALGKRTPVVAAQELNAQRRQSRTLITKMVRTALGITPARRVRNRVRLPLRGAATKAKLRAIGLALVHYWPARYFMKGKRNRFTVPAGGELIDSGATGGAFVEKSPARGGLLTVYRRSAEPRTRTAADGDRTWLPIKEQNIATVRTGDRAIAATLAELSKLWPDRFAKRIQREINRLGLRA